MKTFALGFGYLLAFAVAVTGLAGLLNGLLGWRLALEGTVAPPDAAAGLTLIGIATTLALILLALTQGGLRRFLERHRILILPYLLVALALSAAPITWLATRDKPFGDAHAALIADIRDYFERAENIAALSQNDLHQLFGEAIRRGRPAIARLLAQHMQNLKGTDSTNYASLTVYLADPAMLQVLIDFDADFSHRAELTGDGLLAMLVGGAGTEANQIHCIRLMQKYKLILVNDTNTSGATALMIAAERGAARVVAELIRLGANVDARDSFGNTALLKACERSFVYPQSTEAGKLAVIRVLAEAGADVKVKNQIGQTCRSLALSSGYRKLASTLPR